MKIGIEFASAVERGMELVTARLLVGEHLERFLYDLEKWFR